jgi:uncharacterized membrane protein
LLSVESIYRNAGYQTSFDLAVYDQLLWLLAHGHDPFSTLVSRPMLGDHFTPGLVLLTPLYWLGLGVPGLLTVQSIGLALTAPALYALARDTGASPRLASVPAFLWLVSPWTATVNLFEFHPTAFAPALLTMSVLAARRGQWALLTATALLAMSLREDVATSYLVLGLLLAWHGRRRLGAIVAVTAALWVVVSARVIESQSDTLEFFGKRFAGDRGGTVGEALAWMAKHPWDTLVDAVTNSGSDVLLLIAATGGLALLAPSWALLALPTILHNALTANVFQHDLLRHYHLLAGAGLFIAAALGVGRLPELRRARVVAIVAGLEVVAIAIGGGLVQHDVWIQGQFLQRSSIRGALALIPADASVAATIHLQPHLSQRSELYALPEPFIPWDWGSPLSRAELRRRADALQFVAYYEGDGPSPYVERVLPLLPKEGFVEIYHQGSMRLFERRKR